MFICDACSQPTGPRIKPVKVVFPSDIRAVTYENVVVDPETERKSIKTTHGAEIVHEFSFCPGCADGVVIPGDKEPN